MVWHFNYHPTTSYQRKIDVTLADFKISSLTFEIRYPDAYILWDRAGTVAEQISRLWPGVTLQDTQPNQQQLVSEGVRILSGVRTSNLVIYAPKHITEPVHAISETLKIWTSNLELERFSRVGTRVVYFKDFPDIQSAAGHGLTFGLLLTPPSPIFNHQKPLGSADVTLRWEDPSHTTVVSIKTQSVKMDVARTPEFPDFAGFKEERHHSLIDVDRGTVGDVECSDFRVSEWLKAVEHLHNRDLPKLLSPRRG